MPELPEVETVRRGLEPFMAGRRIMAVAQRRPGLRFPFPPQFATRLEGRVITRLQRRAKTLLWHLDDGWTVLVHLGMSGRLIRYAANTANQHSEQTIIGRHDHVILTLDDGVEIRFNDARRFGFMDLAEPGGLAQHPRLKHLGLEPFDPALDGIFLSRALANRRIVLKAALMDQHIIAGLGNIYACEAMFQARMSPWRCVRTLTVADAERLIAAIRDVLTAALAAGGSSLRDFIHASGAYGSFQHSFAVYGRAGAPCPGCTCGGTIERIVQAGRSTFYCPHWQQSRCGDDAVGASFSS